MSETVVTRMIALTKHVTEVAQQCGREMPRIVAVSKLKPASDIKMLYDYGHRDFGENYVKELIEKAEVLPADIKWHMIGHLQSNKCLSLVKKVPNLYVVESVDSIKLADKLNTACLQVNRSQKLNVFVEVQTTDEETKTGCPPEEGVEVAEYIFTHCDRLNLMGFMTMAKFGVPPEPYFEKLSSVAKQFMSIHKMSSIELSMGMSADWEAAVKMGSTNIRVGTTIFGARDHKLCV